MADRCEPVPEFVSPPSASLGDNEERANWITSGTGMVLALAGEAVLITLAGRSGSVWHVVSCSIYGAALVLLHTASTLYHASRVPRTRRILRVLDHAAILFLIAGTYTPFALVNLRGDCGWPLFGVVWGLAILGACVQGYLRRRWPVVVLAFYLGLGWAVIGVIKPVLAAVAPGGLVLLLVGGLAYTLGITFYAWHRLPYHHAIWHGFVLAGSLAHYLAILGYVLPVRR